MHFKTTRQQVLFERKLDDVTSMLGVMEAIHRPDLVSKVQSNKGQSVNSQYSCPCRSADSLTSS